MRQMARRRETAIRRVEFGAAGADADGIERRGCVGGGGGAGCAGGVDACVEPAVAGGACAPCAPCAVAAVDASGCFLDRRLPCLSRHAHFGDCAMPDCESRGRAHEDAT
jgi:hypothetical protein